MLGNSEKLMREESYKKIVEIIRVPAVLIKSQDKVGKLKLNICRS